MYLALNTATDLLTVTLTKKDGTVLDHQQLNARQNHAALLSPAIESMLENRQRKLQGIICALGPGSFTGIRIGLSTANALAYGFDIPIVGISLLDAWAVHALHFFSRKGKGHQLDKIRSLLTIIDAGRAEVYCAKYDRGKKAGPSPFPSWTASGIPTIRSLPPGKDTPLNVNSSPLLALLTTPTLICGWLQGSYADQMVPRIDTPHLSLLYFDRQADLSREIIELGIPLLTKLTTFGQSGALSPLYIREAQITQSKKVTLL